MKKGTCCIKGCGLVRPLTELRPFKPGGRFVGYRCYDKHGRGFNKTFAAPKKKGINDA